MGLDPGGKITGGRPPLEGVFARGRGNCSKKSSAGNCEKASFITDWTRTVTCSRIWGLTSLMIKPEFWLMKSLTVFATAGARPSNRLSSCTCAEAMSKSMLVRLILKTFFPGGPTGSMASEPTPVATLPEIWTMIELTIVISYIFTYSPGHLLTHGY